MERGHNVAITSLLCRGWLAMAQSNILVANEVKRPTEGTQALLQPTFSPHSNLFLIEEKCDNICNHPPAGSNLCS